MIYIIIRHRTYTCIKYEFIETIRLKLANVYFLINFDCGCIFQSLSPVPALGPLAGWCTWPAAPASPRPGSASSGRSSPAPPAAAR